MVAIELRAFLKRFEGYEEALFETQLVDLNATSAEQKKRLGKNNALNMLELLMKTKLFIVTHDWNNGWGYNRMRGGFVYWLDVTTTENISSLVSYYLILCLYWLSY